MPWFSTAASRRATSRTRWRQHYTQEATRFVEEGYQNASQQLRDGVHQAEDLVRKRPVESVAVAFGVGIVAGVLVALVLRSR
jgi:ElaB/YqjD/DUF883 family membrane-anchored ribosome-binding protein